MFYIISRYKSKKAFVPIGCKSIKYFPKKIFFGVKGVLWHLSRKESFFVFDMFRKLSFKPVHGGT